MHTMNCIESDKSGFTLVIVIILIDDTLLRTVNDTSRNETGKAVYTFSWFSISMGLIYKLWIILLITMGPKA